MILEVNGLTKHFGGVRAVDNLNLVINQGEIVGMIGPNGAGKTTTFNLITGILKPDSGTVKFKGENITNLKPFQIARRGIVRTFQIVKYFPNVTVFDHIYIGAIAKNGLRADRKTLEPMVNETLQFLHLKDKKNVLVKSLTIPFKKRVELATSLVLKPKLLLLDELMAGLNPAEIDEYLELLRKINRELGITMIVVEHVMKAVMRLCQRIIVLHFGRKIAEGPPEEVSRNPEVVRVYLGEGAKYA